jgi:hypothetical protein
MASILKRLLSLAAICILALPTAAHALPKYTITQFSNPSFISEALRVDLAGQPYIAHLPFSVAGFTGFDRNKSGIYAGVCSPTGFGADMSACQWSTANGATWVPFERPVNFPGQAYATAAYDINELGDILGGPTNVNLGNVSIGLQILRTDSTLLTLPVNSYRRPSFNSFLEVVGGGSIGNTFYHHAGQTFDLPALVSNIGLFQIAQVTDINDRGYISGWGFDPSANQQRAFVLSAVTAVPEPSAVLLALPVLMLLLSPCFRRELRNN